MIREASVDEPLLRRMLKSQFPDWADLSIARVVGANTDNAIFRLGGELSVRLPRIEWAIEQAPKERLWLPRLAPLLSLEIPTPVAEGRPSEDYPWTWSILRWIEGDTISTAPAAQPSDLAAALAEFLLALRKADVRGAPGWGAHNHYRGAPLALLNKRVRTALKELEHRLDVTGATALWEELQGSPAWPEPPVWVHGDLHGQNLLARGGKLAAVIDFGLLGAGDPAADIIVAWNLLSGASRREFRRLVGADDATWARGRAWALFTSVIALPFYWDSNPSLVTASKNTLNEVLAG